MHCEKPNPEADLVNACRRRLLRLASAAAAAGLAAAPGRSALARPPLAPGGESQSVTASPQNILVAGATGRTGKLVVAELLAQGHRLRGLARNIEVARVEYPAVEWVSADLKAPGSLGPAVRGVDRIVFAVGANVARDPANLPEMVEFGGVAALVDLGKTAGIKHFVLMSSGGVGHADPTATSGFAGVMRYKHDAENYLRRSDLSYSIVRPGSLSDDAAGKHHIALCQGDPVWANLATMTRADVALVIAHALFDPAAVRKTFEVFNARTHDPEGWKSAFAKLKAD